jgi:hypothetical protein
MKTVSITCDQCGNDLSTPTPRPDYFLTLTEHAAPTTNFVYSVHIERQLKSGDMHFCGLGCLVKHFCPAA